MPSSLVVWNMAVPLPVRQMEMVRDSPGRTGLEKRPYMPLKRDGSEPARLCSRARPLTPYVHRPCRIGRSNPARPANFGSACSGFSRPILHGLCTYGVTGRALLRALCDGDPARFRSMSGRFSRPVFPGETLTVSIWRDGEASALFQTANQDGAVVIDRGRLATRG